MNPLTIDDQRTALEPWPQLSHTVGAFFFDRHFSRGEIQTTIKIPDMFVLDQVHGNTVIDLCGSPTPIDPHIHFKADAVVTNRKNLALTIHTADCLPILFTDGKLIGACHAGWRGLKQNIIDKALDLFEKQGGDIAHALVAIGPCIDVCHFEVGLDIVEALTHSTKTPLTPEQIKSLVAPHSNFEKKYVNLKKLAVLQMMERQIPKTQIQVSNICTYCQPTQYFSYRRDGATAGRQEAVIFLRPG